MNERSSSNHISDEEILRQHIQTREHVKLPDDLPEDLKEAIESDPNPQTVQWVIDESHGDLSLLRLLLERDKITDQLVDPDSIVSPETVMSQLEPVKKAIVKRKLELGLYKWGYRF